jgi:hypothetical protein
VIDDPTRPVTKWKVYENLQQFHREQFKDFMCGYSRDLMQSQPNHVEIVVEKNTLRNILQPIASKFGIPFTSGRGQCSTRPLYDIRQRYRSSGKGGLVIVAMSDLDPDGDAIAESIGRRLRDDFHVYGVRVVKAALTFEQVEDLGLPESFERAKTGSSNYNRYVERYGSDDVWELEALAPDKLQGLLEDAIDSVIDVDAFNDEVAAEEDDAAHNEATRRIAINTLRGLTGDNEEE